MNKTFIQSLVNRLVSVRPGEGRALAWSFAYFFCLLAGYYVLRPVRDEMGLASGIKNLPWLFTATFIVMLAVVPVYGALVARLSRQRFIPLVYHFFVVNIVIFWVLLTQGIALATTAQVFFVWISVLNLMLVSVFWSFLLEMFDSEQAKRLFGFVAAGGTLGALIGPFTAGMLVDRIGNAGVLYLGAAGFLGAIVCQRVLIKIWNRDGSGRENADVAPRTDHGLGGNPFAGIAIVLRSPYLLGIALFVVLLSAVNTFLYFEQLRIVSDSFTDTKQRTEMFATIDFIVQSLTIVSQLFLTGRIASALGVRSLLTFVPVVMILGFALLSVFNVFGMIATLLVVRRFGEYSFIRPGREMLWSRLDTETKYKAKSFVDVPVYRAADYVGAQAKTAIEAMGTSPAGAALIGSALAAIWAVNGWLLGRRHDSNGGNEQ